MTGTPSTGRSRALDVALTLSAAAAGGALFGVFGLPGGWLTGAMLTVAAGALSGFRTLMPVPVRHVFFLLLGTSIGANVTPEMLARTVEWPGTLAGVVATVLIVQVSVQALLMRVYRWDWATAFFAAIPGMTSYVTVVALATKADIRLVAILQTVRAFLLVAILPPLFNIADPSAVIGGAAPAGTLTATALSLAAGAAGGAALARIGSPAAWLVGSMVASAALHGSGLAAGALPRELVITGLVGIGALVGGRFAGFSLAMLRMVAGASLAAFALSLSISATAAWLAALAAGQPFRQVAMAYAPGGIDVMTALAFAMHLDSLFVAAHQLVRFLLIVLIVPPATRMMVRRGLGADP